MNWLANPLLPLAAAALGILLSLVLFVNLKCDQARLLKRLSERCGNLEEEISACRTLLAQVRLESEPRARQETPCQNSPSEDPSSELTSTKRERALALIQSGQPAELIASGLNLPRNQVDLLSKVRRAASAVAG